jgi:hypothetical protein
MHTPGTVGDPAELRPPDRDAARLRPADRDAARLRPAERGAGVVEWLGISALSIALLATIFTALNAVGLDLVDYIRSTLGI